MKTLTISYNIVRSSDNETTYMLIEILKDKTAKNVACEIALSVPRPQLDTNVKDFIDLTRKTINK